MHEPEVGGQVVPYHQEGQSVPMDTVAWHRSPAAEPAWIRRYLVAREACQDDNEAVRRARVSVPIILRECAKNPGFAALRQQAIDRTLTVTSEVGTQLAREEVGSLVLDAIQESRDPGVAARDRVTNRRLVLETAGVVGQGAQAQGAGVSVPLSGAQVTLLVQGMSPQQLAETLRALVRAQAPAPTQAQVVQDQDTPRGGDASKEAGAR